MLPLCQLFNASTRMKRCKVCSDTKISFILVSMNVIFYGKHALHLILDAVSCCYCCQERQVKSSDANEDDTAAVEPPLWKCYWTKMQLMLLLSGLFMLIGSLLHLSCPLLLIFILTYVENKANIGKTGANATLPLVRLSSIISQE